MALPQNTVKLLEAFENSSDPRHRNGLIAELKVIRLYLKKGFYLKSHRQEYFKTEIDIVMESKSKIIFIEVKYVTDMDFAFYRLSQSQKRRLENVFIRYLQYAQKEVEFHYVICTLDSFHIYDDFLSG